MGRKILLIVASQGFRDEEYSQPKEIFETAGFEVQTASSKVGEIIGKLNGRAEAEMQLKDVDPSQFEAIVFVGGPGAVEYFHSPTALGLAKTAFEQNKVVAAICIAPSILANAQILKGKQATAFPTEAENLRQAGALYLKQPVVVDGRIVTASGPEAASEFAQKIVQLLQE